MPKLVVIPTEISSAVYTQLLKSIRQKIHKTEEIIAQQRVKTYWTIGRMMHVQLAKSGIRQGVAALSRRLSGDLNIDERSLQSCEQFYRVYPKLNLSLPLTWSHYCRLITLDSDKARRVWEKRIVREKMSSRELTVLLQEQRAALLPRQSSTNLPVQRGQLYHYRLIKVDTVNDAKGGIMVDCGFDNYIIPPPGDGKLMNKRIVRSACDQGRYGLKLSKVTKAEVYTYRAIIERVVDGDTLLASVDCGFGIWTRQYLRLKGINSPESKTIAGTRAKDFVAAQLSKCPLVVVKTYKTDKYDRYIADIFILPREPDAAIVAAQGQLLNQVILEQGHAEIYRP